MKIELGGTTYTSEVIRKITFAPEVDFTGATVPLCSFSALIETEDDPAIGSWAILKDDSNVLYAQYILARKTASGGVLSIKAYSTLYWLESGESLANYLDAVSVPTAIYNALGGLDHTLDSSFSNITISGYKDRMSSREYIHLLCDAIGAYVSQAFRQDLGISSIPSTAKVIPLRDTYYHPETKESDLVKSVRATVFVYTELPNGEMPESWDEWVCINGTYYTVGKGWSEATNQNIPSGTLGVASVELENSLVTSDNYNSYITQKMQFYFNNKYVEADVVNNAQYAPGDKVTVYTSRKTAVTGWIQSMDFTFGKAVNKCHIKVIGTEDVPMGGDITIRHLWGEMLIKEEEGDCLPIGMSYRYTTEILDENLSNGHRYIFLPQSDYVDITATSQSQTIDIYYDAALDWYQNILHILIVDELSTTTETEDGEQKTIVIIDESGIVPTTPTGETGTTS